MGPGFESPRGDKKEVVMICEDGLFFYLLDIFIIRRQIFYGTKLLRTANGYILFSRIYCKGVDFVFR